jgi:hypothetical protein
MRRCLYLSLFLLFINLNTSFAAQKPAKAVSKLAKAIAKPAKAAAKPATLVLDTSNVAVRQLSKAALDKYRSQPDFQYKETEVSISAWDRFWRWFWHWLRSLFQFKPVKGHPSMTVMNVILTILKYVVLTGCVGAIIYFIFKMAGVDLSFLFRRKSKAVPIPYTESLENIHDINFDNAIEEAINKHNYRLAVRLLYLKCLKQLSDASLIKWQPEKTNNSYLNELADADQKVIFNSLTRRFEYVWYGEFPIDGQTFNRINLQFQEFKSKIA